MTSISISSSLPPKIIQDLKEAGAEILDKCEIPIILLVESQKATELYMNFLASDTSMDPVLLPTFGHPLDQYQSANVKAEVHSLLATFQSMGADNFGPAAAPIPFIRGISPPLGGYQFNNAKMSIIKVQHEIENPSPQFTDDVPLLSQVASGSVIVDLRISYANCIVVRRLRKA